MGVEGGGEGGMLLLHHLLRGGLVDSLQRPHPLPSGPPKP